MSGDRDLDDAVFLAERYGEDLVMTPAPPIRRTSTPSVASIEDVVEILDLVDSLLTVREVCVGLAIRRGDPSAAWTERTNVRTRLWEAEAMGLAVAHEGRPVRFGSARRARRDSSSYQGGTR